MAAFGCDSGLCGRRETCGELVCHTGNIINLRCIFHENQHEPQESEITDLAIILDYEHLDLRFTRSVNVSVLFRERRERTPDLESLGGNR